MSQHLAEGIGECKGIQHAASSTPDNGGVVSITLDVNKRNASLELVDPLPELVVLAIKTALEEAGRIPALSE
jgi:hypothetical protein